MRRWHQRNRLPGHVDRELQQGLENVRGGLGGMRRGLAGQPATLVYVEAIANPLLRLVDVAALAKLAHTHGATLAVDATFASPVLFRPAALGADVVIHSLTKYVNGHGDVMGGSVAG